MNDEKKTHPIDEYRVFGNPIAHSLSPRIHQAFARQTGQSMHYSAQLVAEGRLPAVLYDFFEQEGGRGANITVPFKTEACALADVVTPRAKTAGAANTLSFIDGRIHADNTDGIGLVRDLCDNLHIDLAGSRVLLLGAGGAARGVIAPLLDERLDSLTIANRTERRATELAERFSHAGRPVDVRTYEKLGESEFDLIVNATSISLHNQELPLAKSLFANSFVYDMAYSPDEPDTPFLREALRHGAKGIADGLGMLVEQAAEAFLIWRGVRPETRPVLEELRSQGVCEKTADA